MILVLNSGSTSLKFKVFDKKLNQVYFGLIEKIGHENSIINLNGKIFHKRVSDHKYALCVLDGFLKNNLNKKIDKVVHRIVHGGIEFNSPIVLNKNIIKKISRYNNLAPLHNPINLKVAENAMLIWKNVKHIGVFDTMFFKDLPEISYRYGISDKYLKKYFIRKYGFHGFSHLGMLQESAKILKKKTQNCNIITCHLGGGSSIAVIKNGIPIDVSMGFSPLSGTMMMTRSGDIDPSIIETLYKQKIKIEEIFQNLNFDSGIKGISGISDLRDIMILNGYRIPKYKSHVKPTRENKKKAKLALDMFIYRIQRYISSYMTLLPKIDAIVFSGGIGERNKDIRNLIMRNTYFKKIKVIVVNCDEEKNMAMLV